MRASDFLEILQDAAFELIDALDADLLHVDRRLFAADAAGAERHDGLAGKVVLVRGNGGRKLSELLEVIFDDVLERAHGDFIVVARVQHHHLAALVVVALIEPALEVRRRDRRRAPLFRADQRVAHGDDFFLHAHQQAAERLVVGQAFFRCQVGKTRVGTQPANDTVNALARAGQEDVDALGRQQHGALQLARLALGQQSGAQGFAVIEGDEFVSGNIDHLHVLPRHFLAPWVTR